MSAGEARAPAQRSAAASAPWLAATAGRFLRMLAAIACSGAFILAGCKRTAPPTAPAPKASPAAAAFRPADPAIISANNRAVGLMGQYRYEEAREVFQSLADAHPDWLDVQVNLAIAVLNRQREGDEQAALALLQRVLAVDAEHLRAHYCAGLLLEYLGEPQRALPHLQKVATADPKDAYAAYFLGKCLSELDRLEEAIRSYERAIEIDPYLRSPHNALGLLLRRAGQDERADELMREFERLSHIARSEAAKMVYGRMGPKAMAVTVDAERASLLPPTPPAGSLFSDPAPLLVNGDQFQWIVRDRDRPVSITACDIDGDGDIDIFIANVLDGGAAGGLFNAVCINQGDGTFALDPDHVLASIPDVNAALWGDFDNDGATDVYLCRGGPNMLWRRIAKGEWRQVTAATGTANEAFDTVDGAMVDFDHDGDLDIFCVNADGPNELLNNNLDGTFQPIARERGIAGEGMGSRQVLPVDLDGDRDLDIIVINNQPPHEVYLNDLLKGYRQADGYDDLRSASLRGALAADVQANGQFDLLREDSRFPLLLVDVSGTGHLSEIRADNGGWAVSDPKHSAAGHFLGWNSVLVDPGSGYSIVAVSPDSQPSIWRPGPGRFPFTSLSFTGREVTSDNRQVRSNASGIGTRYAARVDSRWVAGSTLRSCTGPGQSLQPVAIGLAGHDKIDFIAIDWSDGVAQTELDLAAGAHHVVAETQRQLSSCPVVFAWDGEQYRFITDVLGVGGVGYLAAPGPPPQYAPPRPWENLLLPVDVIVPRDGAYELKIGEPMEEACYLDSARLIAYDLPPGWRICVDDRMAINDPQPTGETYFFRYDLRPTKTVNDRGQDVTTAIFEADHNAAPLPEVDARFIGRLTTDHVLTLHYDQDVEFGLGNTEAARRDADGADGPTNPPALPQLVLLIDGWIEYPYSQTMFAAAQADADYRAPTLEAQGEDGQWRVVLKEFGYPAGMPRQMAVPLPVEKLPRGTRALRITTNQEIYFDRIAIALIEPRPDEARSRELKLKSSTLRRTGFPKRSTGPQRLPQYDYQQRAPEWDTRHQRGFYTAFGAVDALLADTDDAVAIFGPGEEIHMEFEAGPPVPPPAEEGPWTRALVLQARGWCKDMDLYTKDGETIEPLPLTGRDPSRRDALHRLYNTRYEAGR